MVYFFLTSLILIFLVFYFYPFIETQVQNYLLRNPQQEQEEVLVIPTVVSLDKPLDKTPKKPMAVLDFFKRISLYYTQPFIHSIVTYFRRTE